MILEGEFSHLLQRLQPKHNRNHNLDPGYIKQSNTGEILSSDGVDLTSTDMPTAIAQEVSIV
jgi:hypothetical protein